MESQGTLNTSPGSFAGRLSWFTAVSILIGLGVFFLILVICIFLEPILPRYILEWCFLSALILSIFLAYVIAPLLGTLAFVSWLWNRRRIRTFANVPQNQLQIRKIAHRFLIAAVFFVPASLLILLLGSPHEFVQSAALVSLLEIWITMPGLLALLMGCISYSLLSKTGGRFLTRLCALSALAIGLVVATLPWVMTWGIYVTDRISYLAGSETFSGNSDLLKQTVIVPTLDCPMPRGRNIIWCSSFQIAWNELKDIQGSIQLTDSQELTDRLNNAQQSRDDVDTSSYLAISGLVKRDVLDNIHSEMSRKFPNEQIPALDGLSPDDLVMYAFLAAEVKFKHPFENCPWGLDFKDSTGRESEVKAIGVWDDSPRYDNIRRQVSVLYHSPLPEPNSSSSDPNADLYVSRYLALRSIPEFALDLCKDTEPYQIILARIDPQPTLALTLSVLQEKIADFSQYRDYDSLRELCDSDKVYVPEMFWQIEHRFDELEGKRIIGGELDGYPITRAEQLIHFRLDRCGAVLKSRATLIVEMGVSIARTISFDQPFLICMKKRDCEHPFFVMWVDNAELLTKR